MPNMHKDNEAGSGDSWTYFDIEMGTPIRVDLSDVDWGDPPINETTFLGYPVFGRRQSEDVVQWRVRVEPVAVFPDGRREDSFWVSARYSGSSMNLLLVAGSNQRIHAVAQLLSGGALRAVVSRSDGGTATA